MKLQALSLAVLAGVSVAVKIPFIQSKRTTLQRRSGGTDVSVSQPKVLASTSAALTLSDVNDLIYMANVTLGGVDYLVQLDTGSSDLWVLNNPTPIPNANITSQTSNLTYGIGWAYGNISYVKAEFAGISVPSQAFLDVSSAQNPALSYGAAGLLGMGFDSLSTIDALVNATGASTGRSLLYNLFQDNPSEPNFIAFSLQSTSDDDQVSGSFAIGETESQYSNVTSTNKIPTWPVNSPTRWNVLLDSYIVGTETYTVSTGVEGAPSNKAVVLLDSGTSYTYAPTEVCQAIYGGVSGAQYNSVLGQWTVPCDTEIDMALQFDNQIFPIHPLDVSPASLSDPSTCVGSFVPQSVSVGAGQFDWLIGDNVLRSVYAVYDFGDFDSSGNMGNPYIQMLSLVDPNQASVEFHDVRGGTPQGNITYNTSSGGSGSTSVSLSTDVANTIDKLSKYLPAMLGVMALNALVLIILAIVGIVLLCRRRGRGARARKTPGRLSPMPMNNISARYPDYGSPQELHTYQPVSMALTEDTLFAPPSPAFKGESMRPGDRPKSVA
ncbi:aspartic peptidase domain-containing protein [Suillus clintonianus]|uniref:aspartic peptidase domain-containing protein n=1 Tax=Suillus clintonianus TaxID=1904413 RepID=UPI001B884AD0|nr:aspartic peptidase domain-containing protein [Suillus clintonianus]KAG2156058.1 aspartic peptidase domain-containing protein [Suillus clintonianus]